MNAVSRESFEGHVIKEGESSRVDHEEEEEEEEEEEGEEEEEEEREMNFGRNGERNGRRNGDGMNEEDREDFSPNENPRKFDSSDDASVHSVSPTPSRGKAATQATTNSCPDCGKSFGTVSGLKQHRHIHESYKPFKCESCSKAYTQFSNLCRHRRMHAACRQRPFCRQCGQVFQNSTSLFKHKKFCDVLIFTRRSEHMQQQQQQPPPPPLPPSQPLDPTPTTKRPHRIFGKDSPHEGSLAPSSPTWKRTFETTPLKAVHPFDPRLNTGALNYLKFMSENFYNLAMLTGGHKFVPPVHNDLYPHNRHFVPHVQPVMPVSFSPLVLPYLSHRTVQSHFPGFNPIHPANGDQPSFQHKFRHYEHHEKLNSRREIQSNEGMEEKFHLTNGGLVGEVKNAISRESSAPSKKRCNFADVDSLAGSDGQPLDLSTNPSLQRPENAASFEVPGNFPGGFRAFHLREQKNVAPRSLEAPDADGLAGNELFKFFRGGTTYLSADGSYTTTDRSSNRPPLRGADEYSKVVPGKLGHRSDSKPEFRHPQHYRPFVACRQEATATIKDKHLLLLSSSSSSSSSSSTRRGFEGVVDILKVSSTSRERYRCRFCQKIFPRSANLTRHLRTHTGEQPYKCSHCDRSFSISSNLQRHVRNIHKRVKPFECAQCRRRFGQQINLNRHLLRHQREVEATAAAAVAAKMSLAVDEDNDEEFEEDLEEEEENEGEEDYEDDDGDGGDDNDGNDDDDDDDANGFVGRRSKTVGPPIKPQ